MKKFGKIVNEELEYYKSPSFILGDSSEYAKSQGYKEVVFSTGDNGIYETEEFIIVEQDIIVQVENNETIKNKREMAYSMEDY